MKTAKDRLSPLDQLETPDVWARAKSLEPGLSSDPESPATPRSGRLVAAVVAFAVFIAAGVFAWRSLQPAPGTPTEEGSTFAATLWPEQSAEELAATQAQIDAGNPDYAWRLDPTQVASAFAESVLGWGPPTSDSGGTNYAVTLDPKAMESENSVFVSISQPALPCPSPPPGQAGTCPPPYASELLALQRSESPGGSGVWTVTEARASGFELNVAAGDRLDNGDPISGSLTFPSTAAATTDYVTQYGFFANGGDACDGGITYGVETIQNRTISFPASIGLDRWTANHCAPEPSGFAFVASGNVQPCPENVIGCPFVALVGSDLGANHQPLYGLTAVPISVSVLPSPGPDSFTTPSPSESNVSPPFFPEDSVRYLYPFFAQRGAWEVTDSGQVSSGNASFAWASNVAIDPSDLGPRSPVIPPATIAGLPPDGVVLVAETTPWGYDPNAGPWPPGSLDRPSLQDAVVRGPQAEEPHGNYAVYFIDGYVTIRAYFGSPSPSPQVVADAQLELDTLEVPPTCPVPAKGSFPDTMDQAPTQGAVGTTITMTALLPFQNESGSYDRAASTVIELWWDADPAAWEQLMTSQPPASATLVAKGGEGSCFLSVSFTVPSNAAPGDHSILALETNAERTSGTPFGVSHFDVTP